MSKVTKVNKSYYKVSTHPYCTVLVDQWLMKKAVRILTKYETEMRDLLSSYPEHCIKEEWGLAYPKKEQTIFYAVAPVDEHTKYVTGFAPRKIDNIFNLNGASVYDRKIRKEVEKLL